MRRLRDKLLVAFVPLIVALLGATWLVEQRVVDDLSDQIRKRLASEYDSLESFRKTSFMRLSGQVQQVNLGQAFTVVVGDYFRHKRDLAQAEKNHDARRAAQLKQNVADDLSTIRLDVGKEEALSAKLNLLAIVDLDGHMVVSLRDDPLADHSEDDGKVSLAAEPLIREAVEEAHQGKSEALRSFMRYPDGNLYAAAVSPLLINGYLEGVLLVGTSDYSTITEGHTAFIATEGKVISASPRIAELRPLLQSDFLPTWKAPAVKPPWQDRDNKYRPTIISFTLNGQEFWAAPCPLWEYGSDRPIGWAFFVEPFETLLGPVIDARTRVMWVGSTILVAAILCILWLASRITRPLENLQGKMRLVGQGQLDQQASVIGRDEVAHLSNAFNAMVDGLREKERLAAYVPEKARDAIADVKGHTALGAKRVKASILFSDLRGFTTLSEKLDPTEIVAMLNEYLEHMQNIISEKGGYISDYIGDAILAVFTEDHYGTGSMSSAEVTVQAALDMQERLAMLRASSPNPHLQSLRMGIGINTGFIVEGDMGPGTRLKYAVLGDTVNTAARIQDLSKEGRHTCILVSGDTYNPIREKFTADFMGDRALKGKSATVAIWEILGPRDAANADARAAEKQGDHHIS